MAPRIHYKAKLITNFQILKYKLSNKN